MPFIKITGWNEGLKKVAMTKLLKERLNLNLSHAKNITDSVLDGKTIILNVDGIEFANNLAAELFELGAIVKIED